MSRSVSHVPKYCRHSSGRAYVRIDGQFIYLGEFGTPESRAEYDRLILEWISNGRRLPKAVTSEEPLTVVEVCAGYLDYAKEYYKGKVQHRTIISLRLLRELYGPTPAEEFGPRGLKAVRQVIIDGGNSRRYCNDITSEIKRVFKWAASDELVSSSVYQALATVEGLRKNRSGAKETMPIQCVPDDVVDKTIAELPKIVADMARLQRLTGMRPAEVCMMRPQDIDRSGDVWLYTPHRHKTEHLGKARTVAIGPQAQRILRLYLLRAQSKFCFSPAETVEQWHRAKRAKRKSKVQPSQIDRSRPDSRVKPGDRYTTASYRRAIHRAAGRAGVPKWSPNQLRHTTATQVRHEFGLEAAQVALGHSQADVTQIYAERNQELAVRVARQIG